MHLRSGVSSGYLGAVKESAKTMKRADWFETSAWSIESASLTIKLVRHAQSAANVGLVNTQGVGDHGMDLTPHRHE